MNVENINNNHTGLKVLFVPLDWGLGHATRCIPIINTLIKHNITVTLAGEGPVVKILQHSLPGLACLPLKGYRVTYSKNSRLLSLKLLAQAPRILASIRNEKKWLRKTVNENRFDAVITDNRFGLHDKNLASVFITHQLAIQTGKTWLDKLAQKINYHFINRFDECWVPDHAGQANLAGKLSHPETLPAVPVKYIGVLSRFRLTAIEKNIDLLILLSGPEPQRGIFENILLKQLKEIKVRTVLVRGLPLEENIPDPGNGLLTVYNHLPPEALNELILQSRQIVARSGYSTVMDLVCLQQKALLVPTPGQTEQEYLASYLAEQKLFYSCTQENFSLQQALQSLKEFDYEDKKIETGINEAIILEWIVKLKERIRMRR